MDLHILRLTYFLVLKRRALAQFSLMQRQSFHLEVSIACTHLHTHLNEFTCAVNSGPRKGKTRRGKNKRRKGKKVKIKEISRSISDRIWLVFLYIKISNLWFEAQVAVFLVEKS